MSVYSNTYFTEIETAADGMLAVAAFKKFLPDIVTLDITMPYLDGLSALTKMLEIKPDTSILTISALADHHTAIESLNLGAHQFICKPFTENDLNEALENIVSEKKKNDPVLTAKVQAKNQAPTSDTSPTSTATREPVITSKPLVPPNE